MVGKDFENSKKGQENPQVFAIYSAQAAEEHGSLNADGRGGTKTIEYTALEQNPDSYCWSKKEIVWQGPLADVKNTRPARRPTSDIQKIIEKEFFEREPFERGPEKDLSGNERIGFGTLEHGDPTEPEDEPMDLFPGGWSPNS